ncbi:MULTISPECIES: MmgE/PrpD family protein [Neorhizobium]|uniref:MmgE/PrpD family protein n=1 Tax=Neorhizobium TaxID=1525371 RepID=UPI000CF918DB|nr:MULTISPECIES: MmgE/PrpD family protein [Neorhizobium]
MQERRSTAPTLSAKVAEWMTGFPLDTVPADVLENTKLRILDVVGVMIASSRLDVVSAARRSVAESDGGQGSAFSVMGVAPSTPASAAFINGVMSAVLEFDDTHIQSNIHATGVVLSALLPECERLGLSGKNLLDAALIGSELLCRLGLISPVRMHEVGFHPSSVYGVFGAAWGLAHLRGFSVEQTVHAIGTAASLSAGSIASFEDGTSTKTLHIGMAASSAIRAVALANQGISGPYPVFEGKFGWFKSYFQSKPEFRFSALTDELGERWEVLNIASKAHPCAYTMIPFIAAAIELRDAHGVKPEDVDVIYCDIMPRSFATVCEPVEEKRRPRTSWHGRISLQHTVAEALVLGRMDKDAYAPENLVNPLINAMADKVIHRPDLVAAHDISRSRATVSVRLKDGRELSHTIEDMPGTRRNPVAREGYLQKFRANVRGVISDAAGQELATALLNLEEAEDIGALFRGLRG